MEVNWVSEAPTGRAAIARELKRPLIELRQLAFGLSDGDLENAEIRAEMVRVTEMAMRQIDDLSRMSELDAFRLEPISVRAVCDEAAEELTRDLMRGTRKTLMRMKYSNRSRLVLGNRELLKSVVYNFLLDALNYTMDEEGFDTRAELRVRESKEKIEIVVRDFGPALPREADFGRSSGETPMRPMSSSLSRMVSANFLEHMQAEIGTVRHHDGASFYVRMPILKQQNMWGT